MTAAATYPLDQPVILTIRTFSDAAETVPADPTTLTLDVLDPAGTETTYTWAGGGLTRTSAGVFTITLTETTSGDYAAHWKATGTAATGGDVSFTVRAKYGGATLDLLTVAEGYTAIQDRTSASAGTGSNDQQLQRWIAALSKRVDDLCGPVVARTVTAEEVLPPHRGTFGCRIRLRKRPVFSITSIVEYTGTAGQTLTAENFPGGVTANDYKLIDSGTAGLVERRNNATPWPFASGSPWGRVLVTYKPGRYASTELVAEHWKAAASAILLRLHKRDGGAWAAGGDPFNGGTPAFFRAVDPMIDEFLGTERLLRNYA